MLFLSQKTASGHMWLFSKYNIDCALSLHDDFFVLPNVYNLYLFYFPLFRRKQKNSLKSHIHVKILFLFEDWLQRSRKNQPFLFRQEILIWVILELVYPHKANTPHIKIWNTKDTNTTIQKYNSVFFYNEKKINKDCNLDKNIYKFKTMIFDIFLYSDEHILRIHLSFEINLSEIRTGVSTK